MNNNWFWHSSLMNWVERALLDLTNWVWHKRHITVNYTRPNKSIKTTTANNTATTTTAKPKTQTKKVPAKKAPAKKKSDWVAK